MHLPTDRNWLLAGGLAAVVLVAIAWFFVISPQHGTTNSLKNQASDAQTGTLTLQHSLSQLRADTANLPKYKAELAAAQQALPSTAGLPDFLREMQSVGSATGVAVTGVAVSTPVPVGAAGGQAAATPSTTTHSAVDGPVYSVAITVTATGTPDSLDGFLKQLQQVQPRAALVTTANEGPGTGGALTLTANLQVFVAPDTATTTTPTATPTS